MGEGEIRKLPRQTVGQRALGGREGGERADFYLTCYQNVSMSVSSKPSSAGRSGIGARLGFPDQTLLIQPEATKSLMQEKIRFLVPVT